jgi:2-keto-4-pentenoate hydratase/2-oxohepta-3-ene-1,7-dioic acid hydratase in catechol pathway
VDTTGASLTVTGSLARVRLARFVVPDADPRFAVVEGVDEDGGLDDAVLLVLDGDPLYRPVQPTGEQVPLLDARLLAPVIPRSKVVGVGRNYAAHAAELGHDVPAEPVLFLKPNTAVVGPGESVVLPPESAEVHHEAELAVVIGRLCKDVPVDQVDQVVLGYTCADDVTARDLQRRDGQWARAKGFDTFCPLGPWVVTGFDPSDRDVVCRVNGEVRQRGRTSDMVHAVPSLVAAVSRAFTLLPGDVILTGTPAGVGPLADGDRVEIEISGLGTLEHGVRDNRKDK